MDLKDYQAGSYTPQGEYKSFLPSKINHSWFWTDPRLNTLLEEANKELGELNAFSRIVPNVDLFIRMHIVKEATDSSRIEGTKTEIDEALMERENITPERVDDWEEVQNYIKAMSFAITELEKLPLSTRLIRSTHQVLMQGVRGQGKAPGEFRKVQNWIGGRSPVDARFVPPEPQVVPELMSDLEAFLHNPEIQVPHLIRIAIAHYQFETIHPFLDGNGRTGRLLITLYLIANGMLTHPTLYLSEYLEQKRREYFDCLDLARTRNDLSGWIKFFLGGVIDTSRRGCAVLRDVLTLKEDIEVELQKLGRRSQSASIVVRYLFQHPVIAPTSKTIIEGITERTLRTVLTELNEIGILKETSGLKKNRVYVFERYLNLFKKLGDKK